MRLWRQASDRTGEGTSTQQIHDEIRSMLVAGAETSATLLLRAFQVLGTHPGIERRVHAELDEVLAGLHRSRGWLSEHRHYGESLTILAGDLTWAYADHLMSGMPPAVTEEWFDLKTELIEGQTLNFTAAAELTPDPELALHIAVVESGRYTIHRPLALGTLLAGRTDLIDGFERYVGALGEAFQLRDDLIDAFGDGRASGKPAGLDFGYGKMTLPLSLAMRSDAGSGRWWDTVCPPSSVTASPAAPTTPRPRPASPSSWTTPGPPSPRWSSRSTSRRSSATALTASLARWPTLYATDIPSHPRTVDTLITSPPPPRTPPELPRPNGMARTHGGTKWQRGRPQ